jgi:hypothetical protein
VRLTPQASVGAAPLEAKINLKSKIQNTRSGDLQVGTCRAKARRYISDLSLIQIQNLNSEIDNRQSTISN